jgi:hypothetical protein
MATVVDQVCPATSTGAMLMRRDPRRARPNQPG